jgi:hypothetical protein
MKEPCVYVLASRRNGTPSSMVSAIQREKAIKQWKRRWKLELIEALNPEWRDLYENLLERTGFRLSPE